MTEETVEATTAEPASEAQTCPPTSSETTNTTSRDEDMDKATEDIANDGEESRVVEEAEPSTEENVQPAETTAEAEETEETPSSSASPVAALTSTSETNKHHEPLGSENDDFPPEPTIEDLQQQLNAALAKIQTLQSADNSASLLDELQTNLQQQIMLKAEAENTARIAWERVEELEDKEIPNLQQQVVAAREDASAQLQKMREEQDAMRRKEMALTSRLNAAKRNEADKANLAEQYEDDMQRLERELQQSKQHVLELQAEKQKLEHALEQNQQTGSDQYNRAQHALTEERRLNEERKRKMKAFVEAKAEELRQAKADNETLQVEVTQTNRSLLELNNRWKQLHAQYVQSQTRNRELQRDLHKIQKDSENLHKVGDTLELKLSQSANETAEHKHKRLAAKHELMTVLRTLETERQKSAQLRDAIKFTFTPKALSQQQLLRESMEEFEAQLQKLSHRLGKPLTPLTGSVSSSMDLSATDHDDSSSAPDDSRNGGGSSSSHTKQSQSSDADLQRLVSKLEKETQGVSQCIMALTSNVERMHMVLDASGERTCVSVLAEILSTGGAASSPAAAAASTPMHDDESSRGGTAMNPLPRSITNRHRYGSVPSAALH